MNAQATRPTNIEDCTNQQLVDFANDLRNICAERGWTDLVAQLNELSIRKFQRDSFLSEVIAMNIAVLQRQIAGISEPTFPSPALREVIKAKGRLSYGEALDKSHMLHLATSFAAFAILQEYGYDFSLTLLAFSHLLFWPLHAYVIMSYRKAECKFASYVNRSVRESQVTKN